MIELTFGVDATLGLCYAVLKGNSGISKNKDTFFKTVSKEFALS